MVFVFALFIIPTLGASVTFVVELDKPSYSPGDTVNVHMTISSDGIINVMSANFSASLLGVSLFRHGEMLNLMVGPGSPRTANYTFNLPDESQLPPGNYSMVVAFFGDGSTLLGERQFELVISPPTTTTTTVTTLIPNLENAEPLTARYESVLTGLLGGVGVAAVSGFLQSGATQAGGGVDMVDAGKGLVEGATGSAVFEARKREGVKGRLLKRARRLTGTVTFLSLLVALAYASTGVYDFSLVFILPFFILAALSYMVSEVVQKYVAGRLGGQGEYYLWYTGLALLFITSFGFRSPFAVPSKTVVEAHVHTEKRRIEGIAAASAACALIMLGVALFITNRFYPHYIFRTAVFACVMTAFYGVLPVPPLDGLKILRWNKFVWVGAFLLTLVLFLDIDFAFHWLPL